MPIAGKTAPSIQEEVGDIRLTVVGRLWKGSAKGEKTAGKDLQNKFRFESGDENRRLFEEFYGSSYPESIRIYLPYNEADKVFETWNEAYTAQGFKHRCNGDRIIQEMCPYKVKSGKSEVTRWIRTDTDKPCQRGDRPICDECGHQGRLFFYVRDLYDRLGSVKCFMMTVTGTHDISGFHEQLSALQAKYGSLMSSPIPSPFTYGMIPYILSRQEISISRPNGEARARGKAWVLTISEDPDWLEMMQRWHQTNEVKRLLQEAPEVRSLLLPQVMEQMKALPGSVMAQPVDNGRQAIYTQISAFQKRNGWDFGQVLAIAQEKLTGRSIGSLDELSDDQLNSLLELVQYPAQAKSEGVPPKKKKPLVERFTPILAWTSHNWEQVAAIATELFDGRDLKKDPPSKEEADQLRDEMFIRWGMNQENSLGKGEIRSLLESAIKDCTQDDDLSDESIWSEFSNLLADPPDELEPTC
jgi:hypothetical protein